VAHFSTREPYLFGAAALDSWRGVVDAVHDAGSAIFPQLWHTGLGRKRRQTHNPQVESIAASAVSSGSLVESTGDAIPVARGGTLPRAATQKDIEAVVAAFGQAAFEAQQLGFDGIAIHGAHGYLVYQFYWERSNKRSDAYGGSLENRARFALEVVREIRRRVGPDFPIMFRFSQWAGWDYKARLAHDVPELERLLLPLVDAGVDIFDASTRRFWLPEFEGSDLNLAGWAKKITGKTAMTVGSVGLEAPLGDPATHASATSVATENLARLIEMTRRGDFDLIGVGRALLANADWANIVRDGRWDDLRAYDAARIVEGY
jgi:2,4-dienoyl-CoA reductase-like NADH-dependent reductase (Old Yellow Enzyme family)